MYNVQGKIGGDAELSPRGQMYAKALPSLILEAVGDSPLNVSTLPYFSIPILLLPVSFRKG